eukprot:SM000153S01580  [mRNA]  locus=s153:28262:32511:+ [translate_table: standard]
MLGLDAAGKTTILYKLHIGEILSTVPTIGQRPPLPGASRAAQCGGKGGAEPSPRPRRHYFNNTDGLIYVVDSLDRERIGKAASEFQAIVNDTLMRNSAILVFANKQDMKGALTPAEVCEALGLFNLRNRRWQIQGTVAPKGEGLYEGLDWLATTLKKMQASGLQTCVDPNGGVVGGRGESAAGRLGGAAEEVEREVGVGEGEGGADEGAEEDDEPGRPAVAAPGGRGLGVRCARVAGVEIPNAKRIETSLQYIHGIGQTAARQILLDLAMDNKATRELSEEELTRLREEVAKYMTEGDLRRFNNLAIKRLKDIMCYRGRRHIAGLPCRGQHTKCNARTRRGKKITIAGKKKAPR